MRIKLICCDVFLRPVSAFVAVSPDIIDVEYVPMLLHTEPDRLRGELQRRIDVAAAQRHYDMFVLGFGLCGNSTAGLTCPVKFVMPRVHDCCAVLMGSNERFLEEFGENLSMRWCSCGYYERCYLDGGDIENAYSAGSRETYPEYRELLEKYDKETADYVWETLHPEIETPEAAYITLEGFDGEGYMHGFGEMIKEQGKTLKVLKGDISFLRELVNGPWDSGRFLTLSPGERIGAVYDMERVVEGIG